MSSTQSDVTINLSHSLDESGEFDAFTLIEVSIHVGSDQEAGSITAVIIDRQRIPPGMFLSAMDGHSGDLQEVGVVLFEPRMGRTKLKSLRDNGDSMGPFMYIQEMHVNDRYKVEGNSEIGSYALHKLLHHHYITKRKITSCVYILDPSEAMDPQVRDQVEAERSAATQRHLQGEDPPPMTEESLRVEKERIQRLTHYARLDANQFLRNGFYQDKTVACLGPRYIVAAKAHWNAPLKSHNEAASIQFYAPPSVPQPPVGKDAEILELTKRNCQNGREASFPVTDFRMAVERLIQEGGSLSRSNALHAACALNDASKVMCILYADLSTLEKRDVNNETPLMIAAAVMAGKRNKNGYPLSHPIIDMLLSAGADKDAVNSNGMTPYGIFVRQHKDYAEMIAAMTGSGVPRIDSVPGYATLKAKLMSLGGPTRSDLMGGDSEDAGLIHYEEDDDSMDYDSEEHDY